jgi:hypothetical protein
VELTLALARKNVDASGASFPVLETLVPVGENRSAWTTRSANIRSFLLKLLGHRLHYDNAMGWLVAD